MYILFYIIYILISTKCTFINYFQLDEQSKMIELLKLIYKEQIQNRIMYELCLLSKVDKMEKNVNKIGSINNISGIEIPDFDSNFMSN